MVFFHVNTCSLLTAQGGSEIVRVRYKKEVLEFIETMSVNKLLKKMALNKGEVVVIRNGAIVTEDEMLNPDDEVRIIDTVSGG
ncbi:ThiS family protein [Acetomicrobium hydrogeniformans ATCC BAA-1850]|jgi:sulfur carrier protein|uniref:ThiS family protein n=1 Tax=Acetomicrobium hydrogeniformans ATCC BAA-1850 TaxID=592015 RepID=A0A0T5XD39_9BACT|nr:ThiS family protein [Acetomicrobium hydrogeniformans ATCC BAA-1850]